MPDTAGPDDSLVVGVDVGTLPGRAVAAHDRRGTGTGGAALTATPGTAPTTPFRGGRGR